jgi:hypothetical protein
MEFDPSYQLKNPARKEKYNQDFTLLDENLNKDRRESELTMLVREAAIFISKVAYSIVPA